MPVCRFAIAVVLALASADSGDESSGMLQATKKITHSMTDALAKSDMQHAAATTHNETPEARRKRLKQEKKEKKERKKREKKQRKEQKQKNKKNKKSKQSKKDTRVQSPLEVEHFNLVNDLRATGFRCPDGTVYPPNPIPLILDCGLVKAAYLHSKDMNDQNYFAHDSKDGRKFWQRAQEQDTIANGENIAAGRASASDVLEQWKGSNGHCKNMMNPKMKAFGVGQFSGDGQWRHYWTQMFSAVNAVKDTESCKPGLLLLEEGPEMPDPVCYPDPCDL